MNALKTYIKDWTNVLKKKRNYLFKVDFRM
jgi:hypothetical protein